MRQARFHEPAVLGIRDVALDRLVKLGEGGASILALQDVGATSHHLRQRPVGHALSIREAASAMPKEQALEAVHVLEELPGKPRLADTGDAGHLDEVRLSILNAGME